MELVAKSIHAVTLLLSPKLRRVPIPAAKVPLTKLLVLLL